MSHSFNDSVVYIRNGKPMTPRLATTLLPFLLFQM